ncbi:periplasmic heavy metal sensor [Planktotalea sp.]|uniref:periplasmic heavy metal sensor n=1 Tax=Planktotalea sp. TaxID=2029877 RepID=UPI0032999322
MSDPDQPKTPVETPKTKVPRRFRILLGVSLALNLLVIGAVIGAISNGPRDRNGPPTARSISTPYVAAFEGATKREMRKEMRTRLEGFKSAKAAEKTDYLAFIEIVRAEDFDAMQAEAIMKGQLERAGAVQDVGRAIAIEKLNAMSFEGRIAYADRLEDALERREKRRKGRRSDRREDRTDAQN